MDVHRRHAPKKKAAPSVVHEQGDYVAYDDAADDADDDKYRSRPAMAPRTTIATTSGPSWTTYVGTYLSWVYDWLPAWSAFSWLLRYGPPEEQVRQRTRARVGADAFPQFEMTPDMQDRVDRFKVHIGIGWSEEEPEHLELLQRYWALCFPNFGFLRRDKRWTDVGFQGPDPGTDFRGGEMRRLVCAPVC
jgi:hypothetical protein